MPAMLMPSCEAAPVFVCLLVVAVDVPVGELPATVASTELGGGLVELLLVSM